MSFGHPTALLALVVVPVLVVLYVGRARQQDRAAAAFASPVLADSHSPQRPGPRRHVPYLIFGLALVALLLAVARPQRSVAVPVERASIMLMTDVSGSMLATDITPDRLSAARDAGEQFLNTVPKRVNVGIMAFNQRASVLQSPTQDRTAAFDALQQMQAGGGTATGVAVQTAVGILRPSSRRQQTDSRAPAALILLSDGASTRGVDPVKAATAAKKAGVRVYTVALGTPNGTIRVKRGNGTYQTKPVPPDPTTLRQMAEAGGGAFYTSATSAKLSQVYERLGSELGTRKAKRSIVPGFAAAAALLMLIGGGTSVRWFGRLI